MPDGPAPAAPPSDALVLFGVTGNLAYKQIFPALYALCRHGALNVPVIGVASSAWNTAQLRTRVKESIEHAAAAGATGAAGAPVALDRLLSLLQYVRTRWRRPGPWSSRCSPSRHARSSIGVAPGAHRKPIDWQRSWADGTTPKLRVDAMRHAVVFPLDVDNTLERIGDLAGVDLPDLHGQRPAHILSKETP